MKRSARIEKITDINLNYEKKAGKELNIQKVQLEQQMERLEQLQGYREEYHSRLNEKINSSASIMIIQSYQQFLGNLESAINEQQNNIKNISQQVELSQNKWLKIKNTTTSMEKFAVKIKNQESKKEAHQEQHESDELSIRLNRFKTVV